MTGRSCLVCRLLTAGGALACVWIALSGHASAANQGATVEDVGPLIRAVIAADVKTYPERPPLSPQVRAGVEKELAGSAERKASYGKLGAARRNVEWFEGIEELTKHGAVWCLATGLCHPHVDAQIYSARALGKLKDLRAAPFLLTVAEANNLLVSGSENATLHGILQHALADALNATLGTDVRLDPGQDPRGLTAGLPVWRKALEQRQAKQAK